MLLSDKEIKTTLTQRLDLTEHFFTVREEEAINGNVFHVYFRQNEMLSISVEKAILTNFSAKFIYVLDLLKRETPINTILVDKFISMVFVNLFYFIMFKYSIRQSGVILEIQSDLANKETLQAIGEYARLREGDLEKQLNNVFKVMYAKCESEDSSSYAYMMLDLLLATEIHLKNRIKEGSSRRVV